MELGRTSKGPKIVGSKWVFKEKMGVDGTTEHYKARLVAQGFSQKRGLDYDILSNVPPSRTPPDCGPGKSHQNKGLVFSTHVRLDCLMN